VTGNALRVGVVLVLGLMLVVLLILPMMLAPAAGGRLRAWAQGRGMVARWLRSTGRFPARISFEKLVVGGPGQGDTLLVADRFDLGLDPWSMIGLRPRIAELRLEDATVRLRRGSAVDPDTLDPEPRGRRDPREDPERKARVRRSAESLVRLLLTPARQLPRLTLRDVTFAAAADTGGPWPDVRLSRLDLRHAMGKAFLEAAGTLDSDQPMPFEASLEYAHDDRLRGRLQVRIPEHEKGRASDLQVTVDGVVRQDRRNGSVTVHDSTRVMIGEMPLRVGASLERRGPRVSLSLSARGITERSFEASLPPGVLDRLVDVGVIGSWDYKLGFDLDFEKPDSVAFDADVIPHGLALDPSRTRLRLLGLEQPFTATIYLPRKRQVTRALSSENPYYRPLSAISPPLIYAVVTNEDGAFFRHRGFNPEAVREAIAENIKAGAFRRGAGTITMQLARNLYLGHERSLSRKFREVVLAWVLENLTGVSKDRLLEIYLNVIEWGPGVHGAAEATRFFFDRDPHEVGVDEALFLASIVPAPAKWRYRFDATGRLRPFARAQMHFIGRAMVAKGWLDPNALPPSEWLHVELRGAARAILSPRPISPPDTVGASADPAPQTPVDHPPDR
jgi:hypothetical protein